MTPTRAHVLYRKSTEPRAGFEIVADFRQWTVGFNWYRDSVHMIGSLWAFNLFVGPVRLGWWGVPT